MSLASENSEPTSALRPAPDTPDLQSAIRVWTSTSCLPPSISGARPSSTVVG
ncbi:Uncharacterised protein [Bordetella pertussis]|nr:Uncharacterised protein [Bordetella pertussis]